jgi:hypothetical protein
VIVLLMLPLITSYKTPTLVECYGCLFDQMADMIDECRVVVAQMCSLYIKSEQLT